MGRCGAGVRAAVAGHSRSYRQQRGAAGMVLEGGVAGGVELQWSVVSGQWSVVSGQWLETSAALAGMVFGGGRCGGCRTAVVSGQWSVAGDKCGAGGNGFWRGALRGVSNCSGQWSVVSGWRQVRRWREWFLEGGVAGGVELQWSVVSGQWLETSAALAGMVFGGGRCGGCRTAVVSGQWSVVSGQWSVVSGQWSVVSGQWSVVSGSGQWLETSAALAGMVLEGGVAGGVELQWSVVSGQWSVAGDKCGAGGNGFGGGRCGGCRTAVVSGQWSVVSGWWSVAGDKCGAGGNGFGGGRCGGCRTAVVSGQWSVVSGQWSVVSGQWSVVSGQWSVVSGWRQVRRWREWFWRGALRGVSNCSGQWSVVSGQWLETSAALAGMVLEGGVAGGVPPHKGGPKARPPI